MMELYFEVTELFLNKDIYIDISVKYKYGKEKLEKICH